MEFKGMLRVLNWINPFWLATNVFTLYGGGKGGGAPPDFTSLSMASEKAAILSKQLGEQQLAENKRQYDLTMEVAKPVAVAQLGIMNQQLQQGQETYNYQLAYARPLEQSIFYEAMGFTPQEIAQINDSRQAETAAWEKAMGEQQQAVITQKVTVPTYSTREVLPAGAVLGSSLSPAEQYRMRFGSALQLFRDTTGFDPNAYYVKQTDPRLAIGQPYTRVTPKIEIVEGTKEIEVTGIRQPDGSVSQPRTPRTDALIAQIGAQAQQRMSQMDAAERDKINQLNAELTQRLGETDNAVYNRYKSDIEAEVARAIADQRAGYTNALNIAAREGMRYGFSSDRLAAMSQAQSVQQGGLQAAAANQTRTGATQEMYGRGIAAAQQGLQGGLLNRQMQQQDQAIALAKKLDLAGLYRGLPGISQGAYGLALGAGNSAVQNTLAPSNAYMQGINQANAMTMSGTQAQIQGLSNIAGYQTSIYNNNQGGSSALWGALGTLGGAALGGLGTYYGMQSAGASIAASIAN